MHTVSKWFAAFALMLGGGALADDFELGEKKMKEANRAASEVVKERMREERPEDARVLDQVVDADIASHFYLQQNQTRGAAQAKKATTFIKDDSTLAPTTKAKVEEKLKSVDFSDAVVAGDLDSAYSAQQMTSNIVVDRKKDQGRVEGLYGSALKKYAPAKPSPTAPAAGALEQGTRVKELERKGDQVKVRTMEGDEAWVPASAL